MKKPAKVVKKAPDKINKTSSGPSKLVIGLGAGLLVLVFLGAFGFSFIKSKIQHQAVNLGLFQQLVGNKLGDSQLAGNQLAGQIPGLPAGSTIQTKEEGLATCKLNGTTDCYSLIAVSFNDLSLCQQAPDKNGCLAGVEEIKREFSDSLAPDENDTDDDTDTTVSDENARELQECEAGTYYQSLQTRVAVIGKEKITLGGVTYETCCWEGTSTENLAADEVSAMKVCTVIDQPDDSSVIFQKTNGRYSIIGAQVKKNNQSCTYVFNDEGIEEQEYCE